VVLMRVVTFLLVLSGLVNLFYVFHLPNPTATSHELALLHQWVFDEQATTEQAKTRKKAHPLSQHRVGGEGRKKASSSYKKSKASAEESFHTQNVHVEDSQRQQQEPVRRPTKQRAPPSSPYLVPFHKLHNLLWKTGTPATQVVKKDRQGKPLHHNIFAVRHEDLRGIADDVHNNNNGDNYQEWTVEQARVGREPLLEILRDAGVTDVDASSIAMLPTWDQVLQLYGDGPVVYGLDTCADFRQRIPADDASIGTAGLFNTGTNPFAMYLAANCKMPENKHDKFGGMRWQVCVFSFRFCLVCEIYSRRTAAWQRLCVSHSSTRLNLAPCFL
jgi:hypothetical protein